jgi:hypothetical protein
MSMTAVPISIRRVRAPIAASSGNGDASCRSKWCTRTNAPSTPMSSAACASSTVCSSESAALRVCDPGTSRQCPNERNPIFFTPWISADGPARIPGPSSRLEAYLTAAYAREEGSPLGRSKPENYAPRVLAVPNMNARTVRGRGLNTGTATVAAPTAAPLSARLITVDNVIIMRHSAHGTPRPPLSCSRAATTLSRFDNATPIPRVAARFPESALASRQERGMPQRTRRKRVGKYMYLTLLR